MKMDDVWRLRNALYIGILVGLVIGLFCRYVHKPPDDSIIDELRNINACFWPPDLIPHPHLPQPNYPPDMIEIV
jgi:hypothetical protein